ncbi:rhombosortase [Marinobacter halophilus]|nr:rhombosortase [Marinobacter halophilus]
MVNRPAPILMILLMLLYLAPAQPLEWQPELLQSREWWRLITGHLVHLSGRHLMLNVAGLITLWMLYPCFLSLRDTALATVFIAVGISLGLLLLQPDLPGYRGFSGCLHGLAAMLAIRGLGHERILSVGVLVLVPGKLAMEAVGVGLADTARLIGGPVIWQAHVLGFSAGVVLAGLHWFKSQTPRQSSPE